MFLLITDNACIVLSLKYLYIYTKEKYLQRKVLSLENNSFYHRNFRFCVDGGKKILCEIHLFNNDV